MSSPRRKFSEEEKLSILQQARQSGTIAILRKHNLSYSVFHRWKEKMTQNNNQGNEASPSTLTNGRVADLMEEIALLKKIIANQSLLLELKEEAIRNRKR